VYALDDEKGAGSSDINNIHGCYKKRKAGKPNTRRTPFRKRKKPKHGYPRPGVKVINTPKKK